MAALEPGVRTVNITHQEAVVFKARGKSFAWKFDAAVPFAIDLGSIVPADFPANSVKIFVDHDAAHPS